MKKVALFLLVGAMIGLVAATVQASTIRIAMGEEPRSVMPNNTSGTWESAIGGQLFDAMVAGDNQMYPIPGIAESWDYEDETYTWTFHLRKGVKFHDLTEVTADDVVFSFKCWIHPDYPGVRFGNFKYIVNAQAYHDGEIDDFSQVAVKALDPYTVEIQLTQIQATFLTYAAGSGILPKHIYEPYFEENGYDKQKGATLDLGYLIGAGPFKFAEWVTGQYVKVEKFDDYWNPRENPIATEGQAVTPGIDEVFYVQIPDADAMFQALKAGQIDAMGLTEDQYWEADADPALESMLYPFLVYDYLSFQLDPEKTDLFQDVRVRRAIAYATDRDALIDQVLRGLGSKCNGPSHPLRWDWDDAIGEAHPDYDIEKCVELMEAAGWTIEKNDDGTIPRGAFWMKDGKKFEFEISTNYPNPRRGDIIQILQQQYYDAGFSVTLRILDTNAFYYDYLMGGFKFQAAVGGWRMGSDPDATSVFHSSSYPDSYNWMPYIDAEADALIEEGLQHVLFEERKPIYTELALKLVEDMPYIWLCYQDGKFGTRKDIGLTGFFPCHPQGWWINLWQWEIAG
jgi:peptide/nickel transport system substrate-binding protein